MNVPARTGSAPQADRLGLVRAAVAAIEDGASTSAKVAIATGVAPRHARYCLHAARVLGLIENEEAPVISARGAALLAVPADSDEERAVFCQAIRESEPLGGLSEELLAPSNEPSIAELARKIQAHDGGSESTAERRAQTLLCWRRYLLPQEDAQTSLDFDSPYEPRSADGDGVVLPDEIGLPVQT